MLSKLSKQEKKQLIIGLIGLALIMLVYFKGKAAGKIGKPKFMPIPKDIVGGGNSGAISGPNTDKEATNTGVESGAHIRAIALALHADMDGFNWLGHDMQPYKDWLALSNSGFVAVYNDFNSMYFSEGEGTLRQWIENESYRDNLVQDVIIPKMNSLNLT